jgi:16S rRNA processing protein RimM
MDQQILIGQISRPFGFKGGVHLRLMNENSGSLQTGVPITAVGPGTKKRVLTVKEVVHGARCFFEEVNDESAALALKGAELFIARHLMPPIDDDECYLADLLGMNVTDVNSLGLGRVVGFSSNLAQDLLEIELTDGKNASVPLVDEIVIDIDLDRRVITLDPPEGLLEL